MLLFTQSGVFDRIIGRTLSLFRNNQRQEDWETVLIGVLGVRGSGKTRILRVCSFPHTTHGRHKHIT